MPGKYLLIYMSIFFISAQVRGQSYAITGVLQDTGLHRPLYNGSVILLHAKDSFIVADTRADRNGRFTFKSITDTSTYLLHFSYPGYAGYWYRVDASHPDIGTINLFKKERLLKEIIVKAKVASIRIIGDTTEYVADSFKVQPNANVEDLLRQLPGLQIDQFGNITAQGQKVKKVLVDGEEFFSDDPTLVTRNLRADMIDKVQVYDKRSDAAVFTGVDDGVKDKTINLKIKEDKNQGIFGKTDASAGTDEHYDAQGMFNAFNKKRKMALFATTGNIGRTGLGSADKQKIGSGDNDKGTYNGKGLPTATSMGAHYDNAWNDNGTSFNGNYTYNLMKVNGEDRIISQNNLPTGLILGSTYNKFDQNSIRHAGNGKYVYRIDSTATLTSNVNSVVMDQTSNSEGSNTNLKEDSSFFYDNRTRDHNDYHSQSYTANVSLEKRLKAGKTVSVYFDNNFSNDRAGGENYSISTFYGDNNLPDSTAILDLKRSMNDDWRTNTLKAYFTSPLSKRLHILLGYEGSNSNSNDDKRSLDPDKNENTRFSTQRTSDVWSHQAGVALNFSTAKLIIKAGNNVQVMRMNINEKLDPVSLKRQFLNWHPNASMQYTVKPYNVINVSYAGNSTTPEKTQLLPMAYNNSQLATWLKNSGLNNSFTHTINAGYNSSQVSTNIYTGISGNITLNSRPIVQDLHVTSAGEYIYQYVNLSGYTNSNYNGTAYFSKKIMNVQTVFALFGDGGTAYSLVNDRVNKLRFSSYSAGIELFGSKVKVYSFYLMGRAGYTMNQSSLQPDSRNDYWFAEAKPTLDLYFMKRFQLHTDVNYLWQEKSQAFSDNFSRVIWNAWIGRTFLKNDQLTVKISCNDLLNENNGYSRTATNTFFSEERYTTIQRYFMIGATWSFTRFKTIAQ